jgi:hypothetical protein
LDSLHQSAICNSTSWWRKSDGQFKKGVSKTKVELAMDKEDVGHAKRELFAQFMFRMFHMNFLKIHI